jgi:predicted transcriptional regulator
MLPQWSNIRSSSETVRLNTSFAFGGKKMARTKKTEGTKPAKQRPNIVSVHLSPEAKQRLDDVCEKRGMSIKMLLGRLIVWFVDLDRTEQSIVLGQVEDQDVKHLAELLMSRGPRKK